MFSKFKLQKPASVLYRRGPKRYEREHPTEIISLPLLEQYDVAIRELRAENEQLKTQTTAQYQELIQARAEAFQLREELKLLRNEVAQSRLPVDRTKNSVKFNTSKKRFWECDKASRSQKRKKIRELALNAVEKLPAEFKPVEVIEAVVNKECEEVLTAEMAKIKVEFKFFEEFNHLAETYERKWTPLDGKQLQIVLDKLDITRVMEAVGGVNAEGVNDLWGGFKTLTRALQVKEDHPDYIQPKDFQSHARNWGKFFMELIYDDDLTPYIHAFVYHVPQFLQMHGTLINFNCQPVEKKNHWQSQTFHRGSQKGGKNSKYTVQVMEQETRQLFARRHELKRKKRAYHKVPESPEIQEDSSSEDEAQQCHPEGSISNSARRVKIPE
ncbi:hypothetical protein ACROYT_G041316 [Oculina patagonica]